MLYLTNRIIPVIILGIITTTSVAHAEDATINRLLASQCAQCHGTNGHPVKDIDSLAGEDDLYGELKEMRNKSNPDDIMEHQAFGYTDDQAQRIAAYYASVSGNGGSDSGNGGSDSGNGGSDSGNGGSDSGNGGSDSGNGGSDSGNEESDSENEESEHSDEHKKSRRKEKSERKRSRDSD